MKIVFCRHKWSLTREVIFGTVVVKNHFFPFLEIFFFQKQLACLLPKQNLRSRFMLLSEGQLSGISTAGQSLVNYYFLPSPLSHRFTVRSGFSAWGKKLQKKKAKTPKNQCHVHFLPLQLVRQLWCMMDSTSPAHLSSLETRISSNLLRLRAFFFSGTYSGLNCSKITLKNSFLVYRRFWRSV